MCKHVQHAKETNTRIKSMDGYHQKKQKLSLGTIDLIGPYTIQRKGKNDLICKCVTMIDPATGWFEIHQYNKTNLSQWPR